MMMMRGTRVLVALLVAALLAAKAPQCAAEKKKRPDSTCRSAGVLKFESGEPPMQRGRSLEVCSKYRQNTCCNATHAQALRMKIMEPVVAKFGRQCQKFTEEMVCSSCHPFVGTWEMRNVCPRLCDEWYSACQDEFYAYSGSGSLAPCYGNALICSPLSSIAESGAEFCTKMGFHVGSVDDLEGEECFDGSIPPQLGRAEPTEPWEVVARRILDEQLEDPSGWFIAAIFASMVALFMSYKFLKQLGDPFSAGQLSLEEVRLLQQERYARGEFVFEDETDSSSSEDEPDLLSQMLLQRIPRAQPTANSSQDTGVQE